MINKGRKDDEGFMPHRRWKWKEFTKPAAELGECVMYLPAVSAGKNKFDVRWMDGVWLGIKLESRTQEQEEVSLHVDKERITVNIEGKDENAPRRMWITKKDLENFGCAGCRGDNGRSTAIGHTEA